ncbi:hypothetical protein PHYBLDRAFT_160999 [Phycomyces blakesleeanus NRRL 1555(-)]|uniref:Uncharacterized protein n=1 Tax=Phycomyces blakesleeanus (strain ATCC 8743b / DSM 1359 / FGSC 10004 / NBRC 33097 / NRRL 1555) TaxID=763407 RepID=A0A167QVM8_PHYB8|nr:hypothetical protein PHYBLDRAFT_160999 [Phycomyces blakesleeanus NRRL 1555(-)]OAD80349.1 hypothetical protein PHYBLDRAFT_160999 [Phycomyces blakesleeanus NRRL 1555(-)]|eukprot:XP_018298389.1 hypothetical protein PHYBLDRAFT_160999 [Phycomyces blakesleeanus NRRL 1555(-)]
MAFRQNHLKIHSFLLTNVTLSQGSITPMKMGLTFYDLIPSKYFALFGTQMISTEYVISIYKNQIAHKMTHTTVHKCLLQYDFSPIVTVSTDVEMRSEVQDTVMQLSCNLANCDGVRVGQTFGSIWA